jgi:hypothetical protein
MIDFPLAQKTELLRDRADADKEQILKPSDVVTAFHPAVIRTASCYCQTLMQDWRKGMNETA